MRYNVACVCAYVVMHMCLVQYLDLQIHMVAYSSNNEVYPELNRIKHAGYVAGSVSS